MPDSDLKTVTASDLALDAFYDEQDLGSNGDTRFELEYLLAIGTRA